MIGIFYFFTDPKLRHFGSVGKWIEQASDSLLYYHVSGNLQDPQGPKIRATRGDAQPAINSAEKVLDSGAKAIGDGLEKAGTLIKGALKPTPEK